MTNTQLTDILAQHGWVGLLALVDPEEVEDENVATLLNDAQESILPLADILLVGHLLEDESLSPKAFRGELASEFTDDQVPFREWVDLFEVSDEDVL